MSEAAVEQGLKMMTYGGSGAAFVVPVPWFQAAGLAIALVGLVGTLYHQHQIRKLRQREIDHDS